MSGSKLDIDLAFARAVRGKAHDDIPLTRTQLAGRARDIIALRGWADDDTATSGRARILACV